jgi:cardiolipin synthase
MKSFNLFKSLPNLITLGRLVLVPVAIDMIASQAWTGAFAVFMTASLSDAIDGYLARRFALRSELGALLDPLADKALLVSIYVALAVVNIVPPALTIIVVSRDVMIVGAVLISWVLGKPMEIKPLFISKLNTAMQIAFAGLLLAAQAFSLTLGTWLAAGVAIVAGLTLASTAIYLAQWLRHMSG